MYGITKLLLIKECNVQDTVLIESPFKEETRLGTYCNTVILAITPNKFIVAVEKNAEFQREGFAEGDSNIECTKGVENYALDSIYPLTSIKMAIFKRTHRQSLKVVFNKFITRYFELGRMQRRKIFWRLWCRHVKEIKMKTLRWPYETTKLSVSQTHNYQRWTDKDLYLGSKRHSEDNDRPIPVPGIGRTEDQLFYLKPQYCGIADSTELVQSNEVQATTHDYEDLTYTDDPNSNITYTSLMTTVGIIGQF